jgi:hypothetical protein
MAYAAQVVRFGQRQDAAALLFGAGHAQQHGLLADHLAVAALAVEAEQRAGVQHGFDLRVRREAAFEHRIHIARQHAHAVRVVAAEVGHDEVGGDFFGFLRRAAGSGEDAGAVGPQV